MRPRDVRYWHLADILVAPHMSAFEGKADVEMRSTTLSPGA